MALHPIIAEDVDSILAAPLPWDRLDGRTILVTGAAGFLGSYLTETLLRRNERAGNGASRVVGLVRDGRRAAQRFSHHRHRADLRWLVQDAAEPPPGDLHADVIVHAASQASPRYYGLDPVGTMRPNVVGTDHLLRFAARCRAERFLFVSTSEVYGNVPPDRNPIREDEPGAVDPAAVRSCYAESKRAGETLCVAYRRQMGVPTVIVRPFHTYGPGLAPGDGRVFADFVECVVAGRDIVLTSDGRALRAFCYVSDAIRGILTALFQGGDGEPYNVGNEQSESSIRALAELLVGLFPDRRLKVVRQPVDEKSGYIPSAVARNCPDTSKLRALGWSPTIGLAEGFRRTVRSAE